MGGGDTNPSPQEYDDGGAGGPGAPMPISQLEVRSMEDCGELYGLILSQGLAGLTARDIKLIADGGYHTVEAVAYT